MPVDQDGNRADIIMDPNSTISRMNIGRFYEQYFNAASRDVHKRICSSFNVKPFSSYSDAFSVVSNSPKEIVEKNYQYLLNYYKIMSPRMYNWFQDGKIPDTPEQYISDIINRGVALYIPTDNEPMSEDIILRLEEDRKIIDEYYKPLYGPVSYIGNSGKRVTTKNNARIGSVYFILLEKTGDDWNSVASGKLQHFGILSQITKQDKFSKPARNQAVRGSGEAEVRIMISYIGPKYVAELMDRNNNPFTHNLICHQILSADVPTNIDNLVDRKLYPYGGSKPLQLVKHILEASGLRFKNIPHSSNLYY